MYFEYDLEKAETKSYSRRLVGWSIKSKVKNMRPSHLRLQVFSLDFGRDSVANSI